jgi:DNA polymerase-3 subunit gamma/tau
MDSSVVPPSLDGVTSLYRRFRPGRFVELRGQEHVVRALQGAVANNRVNHAYLFSGPRGTGKTTTARILAKALNCEQPLDGDACSVCPSCVAITKGASLDVIELDAASNNGVEDIREITSGAWHGTPGRWKVYIVDEVHQLTKAASAALLKTLEEPPAHVVFVLATTDPHKVLPTIRSRTQHLEFRLLGGETLQSLLADVRGAAGLEATDELIDTAVRLGRGSARDALSALDQLVATGASDDVRPDFDGLFAALVSADAAAALLSLATLSRDGWEPEQLAETFCSEVRQAFLLQVAADVADVAGTDRGRLADWGRQLGLARTVRVLETIGRALREMKSAPDKHVMLEIALVRLVHPELDASLDALGERVTRLERGQVAPTPAPAATPASAPLAPIGSSTPPPSPTLRPKPDTPAPTPVAASPAPAAAPAPVVASPEVAAPPVDEKDARARFTQKVIPRTSRGAQMILRTAKFMDFTAGQLTLAVSDDDVRRHAQEISASIRAALEHEFKMPVSIQWILDGAPVPPPPPVDVAPKLRPTVEEVEEYDDSGDEDAGAVTVVNSVAEHLIAEMFPGATEIS